MEQMYNVQGDEETVIYQSKAIHASISSEEKQLGIEAKLDGVKTSLSNGTKTGSISCDPEEWADEPDKAYSKISTETI